MTKTPSPPYYAVIFSSLRTENEDGYVQMNEKIELLAQQQEGFLGMDSVRQGLGISISYWANLEAIEQWRKNSAHQVAMQKGKEAWYSYYKVRIAKVERDYEFISH